MKYFIYFIFIIIPLLVSANGNGAVWLTYFGIMGFVIVAALLIPIILLYLLRHKNNLLILCADIFTALIYSLVINFTLPTYDIAEMLGFTISIFAGFAFLFGVVLLTKKIRGDNISLPGKIFIHDVIIGALTILFSISFTYGAGWVLYSTNCDTNIILNSEFRNWEGRMCVLKKATEQSNPAFCNKLANSWNEKEINFCKLHVSMDMVKSGNLSECNYLKSNRADVLYYDPTGGQEIVNKCGY